MVEGKCRWCGAVFIKNHNKQSYCSEECRLNARRLQNRDNFHRWYHLHKHEPGRKKWLGTGSLGAHLTENGFNKEHELILRELRRFKLK